MKNVIEFLINHSDAIITFILALLARKIEKPQVEKTVAKQIRDSILDDEKSIFEATNKFLKK